MKKESILLAPLILLFVVMTACDADKEVAPAVESGGDQQMQMQVTDPGVQQDLAKVKQATAAFHNFDKAQEAGYVAQLSPCVEHPVLGGMGYHYGNPALIDGTVEVEKPEALLYEPMKNGKLKLVGVEYIVPLTDWNDPNPPELFGQTFAENQAQGIWALHVWIWKHNPSGMFADFNPNVSCP